MANVNFAFGLRPVRYASGAPYNGAANVYYVPSSDGTALFRGDPVIIGGSGDTVGVQSCLRASGATSARITGVVVGFVPDANIVTNGYRAASTAAYVLVADDPNLVFEIQNDSVGGDMAVTDIGLNANLIAAAGSTTQKLSGFMLDTSTKATSASNQMRIVGIVQRGDVEVGTNDKVLVRINLPTETGAAGSTGV